METRWPFISFSFYFLLIPCNFILFGKHKWHAGTSLRQGDHWWVNKKHYFGDTPMNCNTESLQRDGTTHIRSEKNSHEREHCVLHSTIPFRVSGYNRQIATAGSKDTYQVQPYICHQNLIFLILRERRKRNEKFLLIYNCSRLDLNKVKAKSFKLMNNLAWHGS